MTAAAAVPSRGFADPTRDAQHAFRAVLDAMARPTRRHSLLGAPAPPPALGPGLAAVALTLLDEDCTVWLGGLTEGTDETSAWLTFHTGAREVDDLRRAEWVFCTPATLPPMSALALGSDESPHESATIVLDVRGFGGSCRFAAEGPGIDGSAVLDAPWAPEDFAEQWAANVAQFPRGVDLLAVAGDAVTALPRTTRLRALEQAETAALAGLGREA